MNLKNNKSFKKHKIKGVITNLLLVGVIFSGIGVVAVSLNAEDIMYNPSNENFNVSNTKEALDEIYKIAEYEVPADTYFYDANTVSNAINRYKKVDGKYYLCDEHGVITSDDEQDISQLDLIEYKSLTKDDINFGSAGYANHNLILGDGNISTVISDDIYFSSHGFNGYSATGKASATSTLVAPKSGRVTVYYMAYGSDNATNVTVSGFDDLITTPTSTFQTFEMDVVKDQTYTLKITVGSYIRPTTLFVFVYH